jgi:hypothetical protein
VHTQDGQQAPRPPPNLCRYCYQKAYLEFFCSPEALTPLVTRLSGAPSITYMAVNAAGDLVSNQAKDAVNAVTWGVFPGEDGLWARGVFRLVGHGHCRLPMFRVVGTAGLCLQLHLDEGCW